VHTIAFIFIFENNYFNAITFFLKSKSEILECVCFLFVCVFVERGLVGEVERGSWRVGVFGFGVKFYSSVVELGRMPKISHKS
jgi:hypothetical protein